MITIRRAMISDVGNLQMFIEKNWKKGHILANDQRLLDWQYKTEDGYNFILAFKDNVIAGILGYIPTYRYDESLKTESVLWLSLWVVNNRYRADMLGIKLLKALEDIEPNIAIAVNGIKDTHPPLYASLGYKVKELTQYYMINPNLNQNLLQFPINFSHAIPKSGEASCIDMSIPTLEILQFPKQFTLSKKTSTYFIRRYIEHPFYKYKVYGILLENYVKAIIAVRIAQQLNSKALRVVDYCGDLDALSQCGSAFAELMNKYNAEYMDFWQVGISDNILAATGLKAVDPTGALICPNFFEPYLAQNGRIICCVKSNTEEPIVVCRADGDQDRPNRVNI